MATFQEGHPNAKDAVWFLVTPQPADQSGTDGKTKKRGTRPQYSVKYKVDGNSQMIGRYAPNGNVVVTVTLLQKEDIPANVVAGCQRLHEGFVVVSGKRIQRHYKGDIIYCLEMTGNGSKIKQYVATNGTPIDDRNLEANDGSNDE